jgi:hypothetical protein
MKRLYVENGVGRTLTKAFNLFAQHHGWQADFQHDVHPVMQRAQEDDVWWIREVTSEGYAILTCDLAIVGTKIEADAVREVGARIVGFANAQYTNWEMMRALTTHWDKIEEHMAGEGPVVIKIYAGPTAPVILIPS